PRGRRQPFGGRPLGEPERAGERLAVAAGRDEPAAARTWADVSGLRQHGERPPQRVAGDRQTLAQLALRGEPVARREPTRGDVADDLISDLDVPRVGALDVAGARSCWCRHGVQIVAAPSGMYLVWFRHESRGRRGGWISDPIDLLRSPGPGRTAR